MLSIVGFTEAEDLTTCKHGKRQSPIDIITDALILDLSLHPVKLYGADQQVSGIFSSLLLFFS